MHDRDVLVGRNTALPINSTYSAEDEVYIYMVAVQMQASIPDSKVAVYRRMESTRARKLQHDYAAKENSLSMVRSLRARVMVIEERPAKR